jgi:hypothetical protein
LTTFAEHDRLPSESDGPTLQGPSVVALAPRTVVLFVAVAIGALLLLALLYSARHVLVQLVVAVVLALALEPIVKGSNAAASGEAPQPD